ncbi:hypothetical protein [Aquimarina megaterium]|uniref:hypothetical protein n=1 Tax=Aquimarina megaterium TaxID=1443666 RepID=UPI000472971E|nr:hypothetical protein [Aquimarina megaterium]
MKKTILLIGLIILSFNSKAQNETIEGTLTVKSASDAIATFQTLDDKWLYTQWKNKTGVRKAYMGFDPSLTNFILGLENGANKFSVNNGSLHLNGGAFYVSSTSDAIATFQTLDDKWLYTQWKNKAGVRKAYMGFNPNLTNFILGLENGANKFLIPNGKVGIGTNNTGAHKLAVEGSIGAREIMVEANGWSDFVFETNYNLPTLIEVENHIKEKGHLKDIPSAKEVEKNGFYLGAMDAKLLQKIEELTLYTIQQEKEIKKLKSLNTKLQELNLRLEKLESQR